MHSMVCISNVHYVHASPITVDLPTGDIIVGKSLPEVVHSSVLLIFVCRCAQTQLNHTFIVLGWVWNEGRGRGGGRSEGRRHERRGGGGAGKTGRKKKEEGAPIYSRRVGVGVISFLHQPSPLPYPYIILTSLVLKAHCREVQLDCDSA